jgi:hypothetical protein
MTRTERIAALAALGLTAVACNGAAPAGNTGTAAPHAAAGSAATAGQPAPSPDLAGVAQDQRIDPEAGTAVVSRIVASEDIEVAGKPACALTVQYAGDIEQPATWRGESCETLTMRFVAREELAAIGQDRKLDEGVRQAIAGLPDRKVLYIEGAHASAIFMPNEAGLLERHNLAD